MTWRSLFVSPYAQAERKRIREEDAAKRKEARDEAGSDWQYRVGVNWGFEIA
jgi:hypothetical protein